MNKNKNLSILLSAIIGIGTSFLFEKPLDSREKFSKFLTEHPFNNRPHIEVGNNEENETDRPDLAWEQDFLLTMNPALGRPTPEVLSATIKQIRTTPTRTTMSTPGSSSSPWVERGPNNVGGRTRAIAWDPNDVTGKKVWAAGVGGGLWYNNDITSSSSSWISVNNFWADIAVTCIAFDPINSQIAYIGTGESFGNIDAIRGMGLWKTVDGGSTWNQISSTTTFYYISDVAVRNESGSSVVYLSVNSSSGFGLQRSINGGTSWTQVLPVISGQTSVYAPSDIEISASNRIWIGTRSNPYGYGGGTILYSDNGTVGSWTTSNITSVSNSHGRVELACAPSNSNYVYAMIEDNNQVSTMKKTTNAGTSWTTITQPNDTVCGTPTTDFSRGQAWYDLILAVDPNNANNVIAGAIDLFYSTNSGSSWSNITQWLDFGAGCSVIHSDQHAIVFKPGSSSTVVFGNDGGVHYTSSLSTAATSNVISSRNKDYNVTQFYACAIHPTASSNIFLAGAQDNGTQRYTTAGINATTQASGGDGAYCFIDQTNPNYQIASYVNNTYYLSTNGGTGTFNTTLIADQNTGKFINPSDYDDNQHILFSCKDTGSIFRIKNITTSPTSAQTVTIPGLGNEASHIRVSPYTTTSSTLFVATDAGKLFKVTNADNTPSVTNITGSSFPNGSISCVEIGASENELLVTFFNYGVTSVWYTSNGGTTWVSKEGNLPDMPIRWALFNPLNRNEVILATELGIWNTLALNSTSPTWTTSNNGMANVRVDMLQIRSSDNMVIAATHGRGLFSCNGFSLSSPPVASYSISNQIPCVNETVTLSDQSSNSPSSWSWVISPTTYTFIGGTNLNSQNPQIQFTSPGFYNVILTATNAVGSNSVAVNNVILVGGFQLPYTENWENPQTYNFWKLDNPDAPDTTWRIFSVAGNGASTLAAGVNNFDYSSASSTIKRDGLISPAIRLVGYGSASLTFKHAYRRWNSLSQDSLAVYVSTNCGTTWTRVGTYRETQTTTPYNWITNSNLTSLFSPSSSTDWCGNTNYSSCKTINLTPFVGNYIKIKFENISGYGNNLYIDDISITGVSNMSAPVTNFSASSTTPCTNTSVTFSDLTTNTPSSWNWSFTPSTVTFLNGTSSSSQNPIVSFNASGNYTVALTAVNTLTNNTNTKTNYINVTQSSTPTIAINTANSSICSGQNTVFTSSVTNGGTTPAYQWKINEVNVGTNSSTFSSSSLNNHDTVYCFLTSNASCASPLIVMSNSFVMTVAQPVTPTISINTANSNICSGQNTVFTSTITNGGTTPSYQWKINGLSVGTNTSTFSSTTLNNNDTVTCSLTSNATCTSPLIVNSNTIKMTVTQPITPTISINIASGASLCAGQNAYFTSSITYGGTSPIYQWYVNSASANTAAFSTTTLNDKDTVWCMLTSNVSCASSPTVSSNKIVMTIYANPSIPVISQTGNLLQCNIVGMSYYQWYLNGNSISGANAQSYSILQSGTYKVMVINASSCLNISADFIALKTGINEINGMNNFSLYPNPIKDFVSLQFYLTKTKNIMFSVYDLSGKKVFEETKECQQGANLHQLNFWFLSKGNYILQMKDEQSTLQRSVVIE